MRANPASGGYRLDGLFGVKGAWTMILQEDRMLFTLARGRGTEYEVARDEIRKLVTLKDPAVGGPCLIVKADKRMGFRLGRRAAAAYAEWRGPLRVEDLGRALKVGSWWTIPVGILFIATSFPIPGDDPLPFDPASLALGCGLAIFGILALFVRTRWLFVVEALWWAVIAAKTMVQVFDGESPWWLILVAASIMFGFEQIQWFRRFPPDQELRTPVEEARESEAELSY